MGKRNTFSNSANQAVGDENELWCRVGFSTNTFTYLLMTSGRRRWITSLMTRQRRHW